MILTLDKIRRANGSITVQDGRIRISAPPGTLTDQDRQVLVEHRETLLQLFGRTEGVVDPYLDQEREAIQWVEGLSPKAGAIAVETASREWCEIVESTTDGPVVIRAEISGDELRLVCPNSEIADSIEEGRSRIENLLAGTGSDQDLDRDEWETGIESLAPCQYCGSLEQWQSLIGVWRCLKCEPEPAVVSQRLRERAARLRRLNPVSTRS